MLRSAGAVAAITLLARVAGLVRDQVFAIFFGATLVSDAYVAAFRLPNILRRLVGEMEAVGKPPELCLGPLLRLVLENRNKSRGDVSLADQTA